MTAAKQSQDGTAFHPDSAWQRSSKTCMKLTSPECTVENPWWWPEKMSETCRFLWQNKIGIIIVPGWLFKMISCLATTLVPKMLRWLLNSCNNLCAPVVPYCTTHGSNKKHLLYCRTNMTGMRFFRVFPSDVRQMPGYNSQRRGTARTLPN